MLLDYKNNPLSARASRILMVEDDRKLARLVIEYFRTNGLEAVAVHDGIEGAARATAERWDLVVLDVMLPQLNGFEVLKRARAVSDVPVLMLTARGGEDDRIYGLEHGADDYLPKTASSRELLARVRALLRRAAPSSLPPASTEELAVGELRIDVAGRSVRLESEVLSLTPVEFDLLLSLAQHKGRVRSREQLMEQIRDRQYEASDRSIDVHIAALRRKLREDLRLPRYIRTVRTIGYLLVDSDADP